MIDVLVGVFIAVNTVFCCSFGATVLHTAYTERWPCLHCLHRSRPEKIFILEFLKYLQHWSWKQSSSAFGKPEMHKILLFFFLFEFSKHRMACEKRIRKELIDLEKNPIPGILAKPKEDDIHYWTASIEGPDNSPYEGGTFLLEIFFPQSFPFKPPRVKFLTKVYHCNIARSGSICLDLLKGEWSPVLTINKLLLSIVTLLDDPCPSDPLVPEIARLYTSNRQEHDRMAKEWTEKFAS